MPNPKLSTSPKANREKEAAADFNCGWSVGSLLSNLSLHAQAAPFEKPNAPRGINGNAFGKQVSVGSAPITHRLHEYL